MLTTQESTPSKLSLRADGPQEGNNGRGSVPTVPGLFRYRSLDHWRGVACLLVVVCHSTMVYLSLNEQTLSGGGSSPTVRRVVDLTGWLDLGVPIFFVISGYCITATVD